MRALSIAATGMDAQQTRVEVISNNLANMNTTAFNARRAEFADLHYQIARAAGASSSSTGEIVPEGVQLGLGVRTASISVDITQGTLKNTAGDLDVAIDGKGYLEVTLPSGTLAYTRDGALKRSAEGLIVNSEGFPIAGNITIPNNTRDITINPNGEIFAAIDGQTAAALIGTIDLVTFANAKGLEPLGGNLYRETVASGNPLVGLAGLDGRGTFRQGYLEESNVDVVQQIAELIEAQRGYELNAKVITAADQMMSATTQIR
ncbi:MAG: flagellar basal-body rod protein FlgG [Alphaproteobacteria bacterium]|nr:flagellar basal-body rod protein FlgG [Alphaproteobacteria bacterium]